MMEQVYSKIIKICSYKKITDANDYKYTKEEILSVIKNIDNKDLKNLRLLVYKKRVECQTANELTFSSHLPFVLIFPSVLAGYLGSYLIGSFGVIGSFILMVAYIFVCAYFIIHRNNELMEEHKNKIQSHLFLEKILDDEILSREKNEFNYHNFIYYFMKKNK